ncbi:General stress protein 14 [Calycomorphotria hydatis]|uniref:General stress protein 14 n=1 Tax=Calycomorphotria hydatis TaxID=2528027 RepID=A0A517T7L8_9PLAN|nr:General stress protein 14 [Calycomorphotria hydatis]
MILGHPRTDSFCGALAHAYAEGVVNAGKQVERLQLSELSFDPILKTESARDQLQEDDILRSRELIEWCDHIVFVYPTWWGTMPALMKGWIDRVFVSGWAFNVKEGALLWEKLLKGRSARLITTMDAPPLVHRLMFGSPGLTALSKAILGFCGISPVKQTTFGPIGKSTKPQRERWLNEVRTHGERDA